MSYKKTIVCLANSRKMSGRCVAGKVYDDGHFGEWVRPVSEREHEEISERDRRYRNGRQAELLDIVTIPMKEATPRDYQAENHLIDDGCYWTLAGRIWLEQLAHMVDEHIGELWVNRYSSLHGRNDRVPLEEAAAYDYSLALIQPEELVVSASAESASYGNPTPKVRARFWWNGTRYALRVTDPTVERMALSDPEDERHIKAPYVCVSLGEAFKGYAYKLVAAVITPDLVR